MRVVKQYLGSYFIAVLLYLVLVTLLRAWFSIDIISMWIGGVVGVMLPDIDSLIYFYYLKPQELTAQRVRSYLKKFELSKAFELLYTTKNERPELLFHSILFQWMFTIFAFYILSSTNNLFGRGLVVGFLLHLLIDQYLDLKAKGSINNWFHNFEFTFTTSQARYYIYFMFAVLLFLGLVV